MATQKDPTYHINTTSEDAQRVLSSLAATTSGSALQVCLLAWAWLSMCDWCSRAGTWVGTVADDSGGSIGLRPAPASNSHAAGCVPQFPPQPSAACLEYREQAEEAPCAETVKRALRLLRAAWPWLLAAGGWRRREGASAQHAHGRPARRGQEWRGWRCEERPGRRRGRGGRGPGPAAEGAGARARQRETRAWQHWSLMACPCSTVEASQMACRRVACRDEARWSRVGHALHSRCRRSSSCNVSFELVYAASSQPCWSG